MAYIARGQLFIKRPGDAAPRAIDSAFAEQVHQRQATDAERRGWQSGNPIWNTMQEPTGWAGVMQPQAVASQRRVMFGGVTAAGGEHAMIYVLHTDAMSGMFEYTPEDDHERRLVHRQQLFLRDLDRHTRDGRIACSAEMEDGTSRIVVAEPDGGRRKQVTEGDTRDENPAWQRDADGSTLVFQSAGIGRDPCGESIGLGPSRVERLDRTARHARDRLRPGRVGRGVHRRLPRAAPRRRRPGHHDLQGPAHRAGRGAARLKRPRPGHDYRPDAGGPTNLFAGGTH